MTAPLPRLPLDLATFRELREEDYVYVDKTQHAYNLITKGHNFFLSRPRRFGKSLLVSTLKEILLGNKDLFRGLWIETSNYTWQPHGVIIIDFSSLDSTDASTLSHGLSDKLAEIAVAYGLDVTLDRVRPGLDLRKVVIALHARFGRVAILIDEYDNPFLSQLHDRERARAIRNSLHGFFSTIKGLGEYLKFVFITGISAFSQAGVFSGMNNLQVITMDKRFADICGYTNTELDTYFKGYIQSWADQEGIDYTTQRDKLAHWYNGYHFSESEIRVYNPFSLMRSLDTRTLRNFWFKSGTPTFLVEELKLQQREKPTAFNDLIEDNTITITTDSLDSSEIGETSLAALMFQTGYLTITNYDKLTDSYQLNYPNREVERSLRVCLLGIVTKFDRQTTENLSIALSNALTQKDVIALIKAIREIFAPVPYHIHGSNEKYYHSVLYMALRAAGLTTQAEVATSHGRADIIIELTDVVYVIEVKFTDSTAKSHAKKALAQIEKQRYHEQFIRSKKEIVLLGIAFMRGKSEFEIEYETKTISSK